MFGVKFDKRSGDGKVAVAIWKRSQFTGRIEYFATDAEADAYCKGLEDSERENGKSLPSAWVVIHGYVDSCDSWDSTPYMFATREAAERYVRGVLDSKDGEPGLPESWCNAPNGFNPASRDDMVRALFLGHTVRSSEEYLTVTKRDIV